MIVIFLTNIIKYLAIRVLCGVHIKRLIPKKLSTFTLFISERSSPSIPLHHCVKGEADFGSEVRKHPNRREVSLHSFT